MACSHFNFKLPHWLTVNFCHTIFSLQTNWSNIRIVSNSWSLITRCIFYTVRLHRDTKFLHSTGSDTARTPLIAPFVLSKTWISHPHQFTMSTSVVPLEQWPHCPKYLPFKEQFVASNTHQTYVKLNRCGNWKSSWMVAHWWGLRSASRMVMSIC